MTAPETPLAGRYRFVRRIQAGQKTIAWLVSDLTSDRQLVASALGASRLKALKPALGVRHKYLAAIVEVVEDPDPAEIPSDGAVVHAAAVALAEIVSGLTLHDQLKGGSLGVSDSVAVLAGICDATEALHDALAAHGAISPRSILIAPSVPRPSPVLLQLVAPTSGAYSTPERLLGQGPTPEDDVWALHASLYTSLTGSAPFEGASKDALVSAMQSDRRKPLSDFDIDEPGLQALLDRGFADASERTKNVGELKQGLYDWLRARVPQRDSLSELAPPSLDWDEPAPVIESAPPIALYSDEDESSPAKPSAAEPVEKPVEAEPKTPDEKDRSAEREAAASATVEPGEPETTLAALRREAPPKPEAEAEPEAPREPEAAASEPSHESKEKAPAPATSSRRSTKPRAGRAPAAKPKPKRAGAERASRPPAPKARPARSGGFIFAALGLGALAFGAAFYAGRSIKPEEPAPTRPAEPSATVMGAPVAPPVASADAAPSRDPDDPKRRAACVASYFPPDTFRGDEDFGFLCNKQDFRAITSGLHRQVVVSSKGNVTAGMKEWATLDWYEIAVTAVVRGGCCPPDVLLDVELPAYVYTGLCEPIAEALVKVGRHPIRPDETKARAKAFAAEIRCLYVHDEPRPFRYPTQPSGANRLVFEAFLERAAARNPN